MRVETSCSQPILAPNRDTRADLFAAVNVGSVFPLRINLEDPEYYGSETSKYYKEEKTRVGDPFTIPK